MGENNGPFFAIHMKKLALLALCLAATTILPGCDTPTATTTTTETRTVREVPAATTSTTVERY
jgi:hypothetical protein